MSAPNAREAWLTAYRFGHIIAHGQHTVYYSRAGMDQELFSLQDFKTSRVETDGQKQEQFATGTIAIQAAYEDDGIVKKCRPRGPSSISNAASFEMN